MISWLNAAEHVQGIYDEFQTTTEFSEFDVTMNEVRFETSDSRKAAKRIDDLKQLIEQFANYPHIGIAYYFLGTHLMQLDNYSDAAAVFEKALDNNESLAQRTPIKKYLETSHESHLKQLIRQTAAAALCFVIIFACVIAYTTGALCKDIFLLIKPATFVVGFAGVVLLLLSFISSSPAKEEIETIFTPPVFTVSGVTSDYSNTLWLLCAYGFCAIALTVATACLTNNLKNRHIKYVCNCVLAILTSSSIMTLFYMNECYDDGHLTGEGISSELSFLGKLLIWHHEVPDAMIPLFDDNLQKVIIDANKEHATKKEDSGEDTNVK